MMRRTVMILAVAAIAGGGSARAQAPAGYELTLVDVDGTKKVLGQLPPTVYAPRISPDRAGCGHADRIAGRDRVSGRSVVGCWPRRSEAGPLPQAQGARLALERCGEMVADEF